MQLRPSFFVMVAGLFVGGMISGARAGSTVLYGIPASGDTFVRDGADDTNEGGNPYLRMQSSGDNRVLVKFDQSQIAAAIGSGTLVSAKLKMCVADNGSNWGKDGDRTIEVHAMTSAWVEGNGVNSEVPRRLNYRGTGAGATWDAAEDIDISNSSKNLGTAWEMRKKYPALHPWNPLETAHSTMTNQIVGGVIVTWDVTADVAGFLDSTPNFGWIILKSNESLSGEVLFCSRQFDAFIAANPALATFTRTGSCTPVLILEVDPPATTAFPIVLRSSADSFVRDGVNNTNEGANPGMRLQSSGNNRCLVSFNLPSPLPAGLNKATLRLVISEMADNWSDSGRTIEAHRLLTPWAEGNGVNSEVPSALQFRGSGSGVTWACPIDLDISNSNDDPSSGLEWKGGMGLQQGDPNFFDSFTATLAVFNNGMGPWPNNAPVPLDLSTLPTTAASSVIDLNVTQDVLNPDGGAAFGWLIKKTIEGQNGKVLFYTREGAAAAGNASLAPTLILDGNQ